MDLSIDSHHHAFTVSSRPPPECQAAGKASNIRWKKHVMARSSGGAQKEQRRQKKKRSKRPLPAGAPTPRTRAGSGSKGSGCSMAARTAGKANTIHHPRHARMRSSPSYKFLHLIIDSQR
jgi:hypothetical protein